MRTVGLPISQKRNEKRRCLIPSDISFINNKGQIYVEKGYGKVLGYTDQEYINAGVKVVIQSEVLSKDIVCDAKIGDAAYLSQLKNQTIYGWVHAVQNRGITDIMLKNKLTAYAWEDMFDGGRHTFYRNNEIAGEAAIIHAYNLYGLFPYETKVAVIGRGNIARGAIKILTFMGADITVYDRKTEKLLRKELDQYDVIVNAVLWDTNRKDHIIYKEDLYQMKRGAMIIDISCDRNGGIQSCIPTSMDNPTYIVDGIFHYAVDHTPSMFYKTTSIHLSNIVSNTIDSLIESDITPVLLGAKIVEDGTVKDQRINEFQNR